MTAFLALVRAELRLFLGNRRALLMSIVAPIAIGAFFGSLFGGSGQGQASGIPVGVVDLDQSALSHGIVAALQGEASLSTRLLDESQALAQARSGALNVVAVLPAGLGRDAGTALFGVGTRPEIVLHYDPSRASALPVVRGLLAQTVLQEVSRAAFAGNSPVRQALVESVRANHDLPPPRRDELLRMFDAIDQVQRSDTAASQPGSGGLTIPYTTRELEAVSAGDRQAPAAYNGYAHSFAGMGVQFLLLSGVDMAIGLLLLRRLGLWQRLRAAPLSRVTLLGSRAAATALICFAVFCIIWAVAIAAFGVRIAGSVPGLMLILAAFALMTAAFGLFIAAIGGTPEATRGLAILVTLLMVMLGGAWVPSFLFPAWLQKLTVVVPTRWAVDGLDAMTWRGLGFADALKPAGVLLAFAAAFALLAVWRFRWEE
jgi:ABC-2 type transport system permease protein